MAILPQSQIPTLSLLYGTKRLSAAGITAKATPSAAFNNKIGLVRTDITTLELPNGAIVNAANRRLLGGGGVDGVIHHVAGRGLLDECRTLNGCATGSAKITNAYSLPCKKVIHAVGPIYHSAEEPAKLLASCYTTSLKLAVEDKLSAIAFSALSTGVYGYPPKHAAKVAISAVRKFLDSGDGDSLDLIIFCNFEAKDEDAYHDTLPEYFPPAEASNTTNPETTPKENTETTQPKEDAKTVATGAPQFLRLTGTKEDDAAGNFAQAKEPPKSVSAPTTVEPVVPEPEPSKSTLPIVEAAAPKA